MKKVETQIPLEDEYKILLQRSIEDGEYLYRHDMIKGNFPTNNGSTGMRWNYINKEVCNRFPKKDFQTFIINRGIWKLVGIYDKRTGYLYTILRESRFNELKTEKNKAKFHYINILSRINDSIELYKQVELEGLENFTSYNDEKSDYISSISLGDIIERLESQPKRYALILFNTLDGQVSELKCKVLLPMFEEYMEENWDINKLPDYEIDNEVIEKETIMFDDDLNSDFDLRSKKKSKNVEVSNN